jgi:predicted dehydrogenase
VKELGVGLIGTGWVSDEYIKAFSANPHTSVVAICSRAKERAQAKAEKHELRNCAFVTDPEEMVRLPGLDIVCIATPNFLHAQQTIMAADHGKHIVIEKPIAIEWRDVIKMKEAVDRAGVTTVVSFVLRWNPLVRTCRKLISDGALGRIFHAEVDYMHAVPRSSGAPPWWTRKETGGSILQENGCHAVDALRWFVNDDAAQVIALSGNFRSDFEQDTTITFITRFKGGAMGKVCCSCDVVSPYVFNMALYGDKGTLLNNRLWSREQFPDQSDWITIPAQAPDSGDVKHHPFASEIDHFVDCIREGKPTIVDLDDAVKTFEIIEAADRSAAAGGMPVKIPLET